MDFSNNPNIVKLTWQDARPYIALVNPTLANVIDKWNPKKDYFLYKVTYQYGDKFLHNGLFQIPSNNGMLFPLTSPRMPEEIKSELGYCSIPLGVIIKNGNEVFLEAEKRVLTDLAFFIPGVILGLWENLDNQSVYFPKRIWSVQAGARSLFMLPKISETGGHKRLKKHFGIKLPAPTQMFSQAEIFTEIIKSKKCASLWRNEIIFFGEKWLNEIEDMGWMQFHHHLHEEAWQFSAFYRNRVTFDWIWQLFAKLLKEKGLKPSSYIMDTVKHLVTIGMGIIPGFSPSGKNELSAPIQTLQEAYLDFYGLKFYVPTFMEPCHLSKDNPCNHVYYSLQAPTVFESLSKPRNQIKLIAEIREIKLFMAHFMDAALKGQLKIEGTELEWLVNNIEFDYFHSEKDICGEIRLSSAMPKEDLRLVETAAYCKNKKFAESAPFVRGCVRISKIKKAD